MSGLNWMPFRAVAAGLFLAATLALLSSTWSQEYQPLISPESNEAELAIAGFKVPDGFEVELFAAEPMVANPVVFCIDERGRLFVCESFRQGKGIEDNRSHMNWLHDDLALRSVPERLAMFRKYLGDSVSEYAREQDRIRLLEDTNNDGRADVSTVFADGFNDIVEGTGAGVLARHGDVFYTNIPRLWRLRDDDGDGKADERTALYDGFGVRVAFRGHDMHGLVIGPDGRLYFSIGDRGYNVLSDEGKRLVRPDTGAVFRCELDGSKLEVVQYGLRNPQELAFDDAGNLFTCDNNSDSEDEARWVQIVEGADCGWRMYFQYLTDRGPWNREHMWRPYRTSDETTRVQPAYIVPPILNISDGPSGLTFYPGVGLSDRYNGHFFLADFRGSAGQSGVRSFGVVPKGATFEVTDSDWFLKSILATDVEFGYDGKFYVSDWVDGWYGPGKGRIYAFSDPAHRDAATQANVAELMQTGFAKRDAAKLTELLSHPDRRIRQEAQFALAEQTDTRTLLKVARSGEDPTARRHGVWGLWQIARRNPDSNIRAALVALAADKDAEIRAQAVCVLGDLRDPTAEQALIAAVEQGTAREQYFAAIGLGRLGSKSATPALLALLESNADEDPVIRHAAVMGLVGTGDVEGLRGLSGHKSASVRLGAVLALRRLDSAGIADFLADADVRIVEEAARGIHDQPIAAALGTLAALLDDPANKRSEALQRRALNANYRLGGPVNAERIATFAANEQADDKLREEAVFALLNWDHVPDLDRVTNEHRPLPARSHAPAQSAAREHFAALLHGPDAIRTQAAGLASKHGLIETSPELAKLVGDEELPGELRAVALTALHGLKAPEASAAAEQALNAKSSPVRVAAYRILAETSPDRAAGVLGGVIASGKTPKSEAQQAISLLASAANPATDTVLKDWLERLVAQPESVPDELWLDLVNAAQERGKTAQGFDDLLQRATAFDANDPLSKYRMCLAGGNAASGKEIFFGNAAASCRRCHKIGDEGSDVGPDLSAVAKEKPRDYLLESLVVPNAKIAKGFETVVFVMNDGRAYNGIVKAETDTTYQLMTPQGEVVHVNKADIDERAVGRSGMPDDAIKALSLTDVRDLVEYLSTLKGRKDKARRHPQ